MAAAVKSLRLRSGAKINLGLAVGGRRPDGYHELVTLYQTIDLWDELSIARSPRRGVRVSCSDRSVPRDGTNLVARAHAALDAATGRLPGVAVHIEKRIPAGGGLGGGSGNAAAALVGLDRMFGLQLGIARLAAIGASLGSDVPLFLAGGLSLGLGRGERVVPLPDLARRRWVVLANPGQHVATPEVFARLARARRRGLTPPDTAGTIFALLLERGMGGESLSALENDLALPARELVFGYDRLVTQLRDCGAELAVLSGSGATVFGLFGSGRVARAAARSVVADRVDVVRTVSRRDYWKRLLPVGEPRDGPEGPAA